MSSKQRERTTRKKKTKPLYYKTTLTSIFVGVPAIITAVLPWCSVHTGFGIELVGAADLAVFLTVRVGEAGRLVVVHLVFIRAATEANC